MYRATLLLTVAIAWPACVRADPLRSSYSTGDGRAGTVIIACPSQDGSFTASPCAISKPGAVTYMPPSAVSVTAANIPVTIFAAGTIATGCDFVNSGSVTLYLDFTTVASAGSATSIPLQPGQSFHCPYPPLGAVSAVASQPQPFVAIRY
jgi:hypothetical protein